PRLVLVRETAEQEGIGCHTTTLQRGGTDAGRFHVSGTGIPSLAISVPSRYIHSHSSMIDRRDYEATLKLLVRLCERLDAATVSNIIG
ncbi:MAG: peptidase M28, partial [Planctomycetota bacterium]